MTITREQLHRAVSEYFEPLKSLGDPSTHIVIVDESKPSPLGFWRAVAYFCDGDEAKWVPINYSTSEDASARLFEKFPDPAIKRMLDRDIEEYEWGCTEDADKARRLHKSRDFLGYSWNKDRKTAILLAAQRWLGIEGELQEEG